jgi:adenosylhomocysteine nucleosidase
MGRGGDVRASLQRLRVSGMGPARAAEAARALLAEGATSLVSYGLAGALAPGLAPGTLLLPGRVSYRGKDWIVDLPWRRQVERRLKTDEAVCPAYRTAKLLVTLEEPLISATDKARMHRETGAVAVDMESGAVLEVAAAAGVPGLVLRAVVDAAGTSLPGAARAGPDVRGQPQRAAVAGAVLRRPWELVALVRLWIDLRAALRSLRSAWLVLGPEGLVLSRPASSSGRLGAGVP